MKTNQICPVDSSKGEHDHCLIPVISHSPSLNSINVENLGVAVDAEILNSHCFFDSGNFSDLWSKRIGGPELMGLFKSVLFHKGGLLKRMTSEEFYDLEKVQKKNRDAQDQGECQQEKEMEEIVSEKDSVFTYGTFPTNEASRCGIIRPRRIMWKLLFSSECGSPRIRFRNTG